MLTWIMASETSQRSFHHAGPGQALLMSRTTSRHALIATAAKLSPAG